MAGAYIASNNGLSVIWEDPIPSPLPVGSVNMGDAYPTSAQLAAAFPSFATLAAAEATETLQQEAYESSAAAGVTIISTSAIPSLASPGAKFSISEGARVNMVAIYARVKSGDGLPGGGSTFNYPDMVGTWHSFTAVTVLPFALAICDYYYAVTQVSNGGAAPSSTITIA